MIHVIATIELKVGKRDQFLEEFRRLVPLVRAETGCLAYSPAIDLLTELPVQTPLRNNVVTVVEQWENLDALRAHLIAPHMLEYRGRVKDLITKVQLQILQPV